MAGSGPKERARCGAKGRTDGGALGSTVRSGLPGSLAHLFVRVVLTDYAVVTELLEILVCSRQHRDAGTSGYSRACAQHSERWQQLY